jgi:hypothetical protein
VVAWSLASQGWKGVRDAARDKGNPRTLVPISDLLTAVQQPLSFTSPTCGQPSQVSARNLGNTRLDCRIRGNISLPTKAESLRQLSLPCNSRITPLGDRLAVPFGFNGLAHPTNRFRTGG